MPPFFRIVTDVLADGMECAFIADDAVIKSRVPCKMWHWRFHVDPFRARVFESTDDGCHIVSLGTEFIFVWVAHVGLYGGTIA